VRHCVHCGKGNTKEIYVHHFSPTITGIETKIMLIIFLGLIAKLTSVSSECVVGSQDVKNLDWNKVGVSSMIHFQKQAVSKLLLGFCISFVALLANSP
jgi:hypothetical protein